MPEQKTDISIHYQLSILFSKSLIESWIKLKKRPPDPASTDTTERQFGIWVALEKKRLAALSAIATGEQKIIDAKTLSQDQLKAILEAA
jgi:hypothetical protein